MLETLCVLLVAVGVAYGVETLCATVALMVVQQITFGLLTFGKCIHRVPFPVMIDFARVKVMDHSAVEAIASPAERCCRAVKCLQLRHLAPDGREFQTKARDRVKIDVRNDPHYPIADSKLGWG